MNRIKYFFKENYKSIIFLILFSLVCFYPLPYYIDSPGGLINLNNRIVIQDKKINGSYSLTYVSEYRATLPILLFSWLKGDSEIFKKDDVMGKNETDKEYLKRDYLSYKSSLSNAVIAAYNLAGKRVDISNNYLYVGYIFDDSNTDLLVGDSIISIDGVKVSTKEEINKLLRKKKSKDKINIKVIHDSKEYNRYAYLKEKKGKILIGIIPIEVFDYKTDPKVKIKSSKSESGGSGGLMLSLTIYDLLVKENLSHGRTIAGTGTIDRYGNVGEIGGVKYKIKGAVKDKADIFFVPKDNYKEAKKIVDKNKYKLKLVKVNTLKEAIEYLKK